MSRNGTKKGEPVVVGEEYGDIRFIADDDVVSVASFKEDEVEDLSEDFYSVLKEEAQSAQRLAVSRNAADYVKGRAEMVNFDVARPWTDEKMFRVSGLIDWVSGEPTVVVEALARGRVRARVSAAMGLGKSTILPAYVAKHMDHRVLYVSLDANAIGQGNLYMRKTGRGGFKRHWRRSVGACVCCMTYADFCSYSALSKRAELFKHFETVIFDEAAVPAPVVRAALKVFAVMALPETNLLMCSANIRDDSVGAEAGAVMQGSIKVAEKAVTPDEAIQAGKLIDNYLADRTMVVLPSDERVHDMAEYYELHGVDVRTLDSASRHEEVEAISEWMAHDSSTPRVLITHVRFGISYNFPVTFVVLWPLVSRLIVEDGRAWYEEQPMTQSMVNQVVARTGRGIVDGSSALIMGPERAEEGLMTRSEKLEEFVLLSQSYVKPRQTAEWRDIYTVVPEGLTPDVAQLLRKVNLPAEIAMRYLAVDGKFARRYIRGLMFFSQTDHHIFPSKHDLPVGHEEWASESVFGAKGDAPLLRVPVAAHGELQVIMHSIAAMSIGEIALERWRLPNMMMYSDGWDSDGEGPKTAVVQRTRMRRVRSYERLEIEARPKSPKEWSYTAQVVNKELGGARTRSASMLQGERFKEAMSGMCDVVRNFKLGSPIVKYVQMDSGGVGEIEVPDGEVASPGGSVICTIPGRLCDDLNNGRHLTAAEMQLMVGLYRTHGSQLVASKLFDCYGNPWTAVLGGFLSDEVVRQLVVTGNASYAYEMLSYMSGRFSIELLGAVKYSNVFKRRFMGLFARKPSTDQIMAAIRGGEFTNIAQSKSFINRVLEIKTWLDVALVRAENHGVFLPFQITDAQRTLPIHGKTPLGHIAQGKMVESRILPAVPDVPYIRPGHRKNSSVGSW